MQEIICTCKHGDVVYTSLAGYTPMYCTRGSRWREKIPLHVHKVERDRGSTIDMLDTNWQYGQLLTLVIHHGVPQKKERSDTEKETVRFQFTCTLSPSSVSKYSTYARYSENLSWLLQGAYNMWRNPQSNLRVYSHTKLFVMEIQYSLNWDTNFVSQLKAVPKSV